MPPHPLPPTQPAPPAQAALLDQEDLDELSGHLANLEGAANEAAAMVTGLRRTAEEASAWVQVLRGVARRTRALLAERAEATRPPAGHCYFDAAHGAGECGGPGNCACKCNACAKATK